MNYSDNGRGRSRGRGFSRGGRNSFRGGQRRGQARFQATRVRHSLSPSKREVHFENSTGDNIHNRLGLRRSTGSIRGRFDARRDGQSYSPKNDPENQWYRVEVSSHQNDHVFFTFVLSYRFLMEPSQTETL